MFSCVFALTLCLVFFSGGLYVVLDIFQSKSCEGSSIMMATITSVPIKVWLSYV